LVQVVQVRHLQLFLGNDSIFPALRLPKAAEVVAGLIANVNGANGGSGGGAVM
jgi:hypothetical protein